jgi:uncharacterized membrane protein YeaQ/YmgE (transglycosylase-associated protein family)
MQLVVWIFVGALAGWIASIIMRTNAQMSTVANVVVGVVGSLLGGFLYTLLFQGTADVTTAFLNFSAGGLVISSIGAVILIALLKYFKKSDWL